jgi:DNA-directed RNA polymerase specialized sigma24 family protein
MSTSMDTLEDVVPRAVAGDRAALERVLVLIQPPIRRYCSSRIGNLDVAADDVVQDVCLALVTAIPKYRDMGKPFMAFVYGIAAHKPAVVLDGRTPRGSVGRGRSRAGRARRRTPLPCAGPDEHPAPEVQQDHPDASGVGSDGTADRRSSGNDRRCSTGRPAPGDEHAARRTVELLATVGPHSRLTPSGDRFRDVCPNRRID